MSNERFHTIDIFCPSCGGKNRVSYVEIPTGRLLYVDEDGCENIEYFESCRDFRCENCDAEWLLVVEELE